MGQLILPDSGLIYLDANAIIYSVEKLEPYWVLLQPVWIACRGDALRLIGSELLLLETLVKPLREGDTTGERLIRDILGSREMQLIPMTRSIVEIATRLRATTGIKTPDAIHAATAITTGCSLFITNDRGFSRVPDLPVVILDDLIASRS